MSNLYPKLRRIWRVYFVADACSRCDVQVATRYVENLHLPGLLAWVRKPRRDGGCSFCGKSHRFTGWLCVACARALGVSAPERDDR